MERCGGGEEAAESFRFGVALVQKGCLWRRLHRLGRQEVRSSCEQLSLTF